MIIIIIIIITNRVRRVAVIGCCDVVIRMKEVFASAEDTEIDVPRIWQYLAEVIGPMIKVGSALPLNFFHHATESVRLSRKVSHLIADVLLYAASQLVVGCLLPYFKLTFVQSHVVKDKEFALTLCTFSAQHVII